MGTTRPAPEQASKRSDFLGKTFGAIDEIAFQFGSGYVNGWEGGLDLGANFLGWATKNDDFTKWARQDLGAEAGRFIQTYANLTPWAIVNNIRQGNYADRDWWGNAVGGFGDIMTSAFGGWDANQIVQGILSGGVSTIMALIGTGITALGNAIDGKDRKADAYVDNSFENDKNERYGFDTSAISDTEAGQFVGGIAHSIGEMLPSIQIGAVAGSAFKGAGIGGKALKYGTKGISTGMMALSASGHGTNEALEAGASKGKALAFGMVSGAIEGATEWIFPDGGVGGVKVGQKALKKSIVKELAKEMIEEGTEEIISELLSPVTKMIYDSDAYKEYTTGEYWKQVALAGASGAVSGGIMSGIQGVGNRAKYGKNGTAFLEHTENVADLEEQYNKAKTQEQKLAIAQQIEAETKEMMSSLKEMVDDKTESGKRKLTSMLEQLGAINKKSNVAIENQVQSGVENLNKEYGNVEAEKALPKNEETKYTIPTDDTSKIMETKLENEDGSAKRYVLADKPDEVGNQVIAPATSSDETSFFVYAKKPLSEVNLTKELSFEKMSKKFNIPTSLEKTYSKKLTDKNPLSVIKFISRYAKTDVQGVLARLGYDAFEYKDGRVIIADNKQLVKGDLKYGETKGTNDYSSLVKRLGRESANEELGRYIGKDGRELKTPQERQRYAQLVKDNRAYDTESISKKGSFLVVDNQVYSKDMLEIAKNNNKLGAETKFIIDNNNVFKLCSGFYNNDGTIYHILNRNDNRSLKMRNDHEVYHYLDEVYHLSAISNVLDLLEDWKTSYSEEYQSWYNKYEEAYTGKYNLEDMFTMLDDELLAEIYSRSITLEDFTLQEKIIDTVNKVRDMGQEKAQSLFVKSIESDNFKPVTVRYTVDNGVENYDGKTTVESDPTLSEETKNGFEKAKNKGNDVLKLLKNKPLPIVENDNNPNQYVMVAPLYKADVKTPNEFYSLSKDVYPAFTKNIKNIAKLAGCKFDGNKARGIYTNNSDYRVREPSTLIDLGKVDASNADLAGSLMADLGYQQQESVIIYNYVSEQEFDQLDKYNQAIAFEVQIPKGKANKIVKAFYEQGIDAT